VKFRWMGNFFLNLFIHFIFDDDFLFHVTISIIIMFKLDK
jgi:hypothetical protein